MANHIIRYDAPRHKKLGERIFQRHASALRGYYFIEIIQSRSFTITFLKETEYAWKPKRLENLLTAHNALRKMGAALHKLYGHAIKYSTLSGKHKYCSRDSLRRLDAFSIEPSQFGEQVIK